MTTHDMEARPIVGANVVVHFDKLGWLSSAWDKSAYDNKIPTDATGTATFTGVPRARSGRVTITAPDYRPYSAVARTKRTGTTTHPATLTPTGETARPASTMAGFRVRFRAMLDKWGWVFWVVVALLLAFIAIKAAPRVIAIVNPAVAAIKAKVSA